MNDFLHTALDAALQPAQAIEPKDVVLYGFGRIGRLLARLLIEKSGAGYPLRLRAIVVRGGKEGDLEKRASLLRRDSVHGQFNGSITIDKERKALIANGTSSTSFMRIPHKMSIIPLTAFITLWWWITRAYGATAKA